jgi:Lsr2
MAKKVVTLLTDDLDGTEADRTVEFGLDGVMYSIDLSDKNAGKLRKALQAYITAGHRLGRGPVAGPGTPRTRTGAAAHQSSRDQNQAVRAWAAKNGYQVSERGRIPVSVVEAFNQAH